MIEFCFERLRASILTVTRGTMFGVKLSSSTRPYGWSGTQVCRSAPVASASKMETVISAKMATIDLIPTNEFLN